MKKKILSLLLAVVMVVTLLPVTAFAESGFTITNGTPVDDRNTNHGYITIDKNSAAEEGDTVTIEAYPAEGYQLKSLTAEPEAPTISTVADVLATVEEFPASEDQNAPPSNAWVADVQNSRKCYAYTYSSEPTTALILRIPAVGEINADWTYLAGTKEVTPGENYYTASNNYGTLKFNMTDGVLTSFTYTHKEGKPEQYDGTYTPESAPSARLKPITPEKQDDVTYQFEMPAYAVTVTAVFEEVPVTIADILPNNFPASDEDNSWRNSENDNVYIYKTDSNLVFYDNIADICYISLSSPLTKEENPKVSYVYSEEETKIQFNMTGDNDDELESIVVNNCTPPTCIGTYTYAAPEAFSVTYKANGATSGTVPANQTKTAGEDLTLATNTGNLAKAGYTFAGWNTKADGSGTHYDTGATYTTDAALTLYAEWNEASATKTIADILPDDFPLCVDIMPSNTWVNGKGINLMLIQYTLGLITNGGKDCVLAEDIRNTILTKTGDNYTYADNGVTTTFIMLNNTLFSVKVDGLTDDFVDFNGTYILSHTHDDIKFLPWDTTDNLPNEEGSYFLTDDVTLSSTWDVPEGMTNLCLNGYAIKANATGTNPFSAITVGSGATLNLYDCDTTTEHKGYIDTNGLWHLGTGTGTPKAITGGIITGGNTTTNGGGVYVSGTFNMYGGNIVGNTAASGGGILNDSGKFTMVGGRIADNTAASGGGIYTTFLATNVLTGGIITENSATVGGGLYAKEEECFVAGTMITMADGTKKAVETLNIGEVVRVFDHENGEVSTAPLFDAWQYPEKHSGVVTLHFTNNIDVTVVGGHSFFSRNENKYVAVTKDNVNFYVGHEFYNVDDARWETLIGYDFIDGEVDTYILTSEKHLNCVANGMLTNEDGFYTIVTNIFEYGDGLKIDAAEKADDIEKYGLYDFENMKYVSRETYDALNLKYMSVAFGKGLITPEAFAYLEAYWCGVDPELLCGTEVKTEKVTGKSGLFATPKKMLLTASPAAIPTTPGVYVGGTLQIIENVAGNLYLSSGRSITIGTGTGEGGNGVAAPTGDFSVGVTMQTPGQFTTNGTAGDANYFTSDDNTNYAVKFNTSGYLELIQQYTITNAAPESAKETNHGYITVDKTSTYADNTVTVTVAPNSGYQLKADSLKVYKVKAVPHVSPITPTQDTQDKTKYTFTMPAYAVTVTAEFEKNVKITGSDDKPVGDQGAISAAQSTISNVETKVTDLTTFNGTAGTGNADSESIQAVLGSNGYVDVKLTGVAFEKKAASTVATTKITTFVFDVTPYKVVDETATEQHTLDNVVTFRLPLLPLLSTAYKYANVYHGTTFLKQVALSNTDTYIEVSSKNFSEYSYTLTDTKYVVPSGSSSFTQTFSTDLDKITSVKVDGNAVNSKYYTVSGKNITLTEEFLNTLANGSHTFAAYGTINNVAKVATATFYITGNSANVTNPDTGDTSNIGLGAALMLISSLGAAACLKDGKKRRNTQ